MKQCPKCGRYMTWYMVQTNGYWKCVCGYDTRSITYTFSDRTERIEECATYTITNTNKQLNTL